MKILLISPCKNVRFKTPKREMMPQLALYILDGLTPTRNRERILLDACIKAKQSIVINNTNATKEERKRYIEKLRQNHFKIIGYYFKSSIEKSLYRNKMRKGKEKISEIGIKQRGSKFFWRIP